jgi:hypothetical protein
LLQHPSLWSNLSRYWRKGGRTEGDRNTKELHWHMPTKVEEKMEPDDDGGVKTEPGRISTARIVQWNDGKRDGNCAQLQRALHKIIEFITDHALLHQIQWLRLLVLLRFSFFSSSASVGSSNACGALLAKREKTRSPSLANIFFNLKTLFNLCLSEESFASKNGAFWSQLFTLKMKFLSMGLPLTASVDLISYKIPPCRLVSEEASVGLGFWPSSTLNL